MFALSDDTTDDLGAAGVERKYPASVLAAPEHEVFHDYRTCNEFDNTPLCGADPIKGS